MKKRILATVCALTLAASMSITAVAAPSPSISEMIAALDDLKIDSEEVPVTLVESTEAPATIEVKEAPAQLKVAVLEAVQDSVYKQIEERAKAQAVKEAQANNTTVDTATVEPENFRFLNMVMTSAKEAVKPVKTLEQAQAAVAAKKAAAGEAQTKTTSIMDGVNLAAELSGRPSRNVEYAMPEIKNSDAVKAFAYNPITGRWEQIPVCSQNGKVTVLYNDLYTAVFFITDGYVPEANRLASAATAEEIEEVLVGGKDEMTTIVVSTDAYEAPFTGETDVVMYFVFAAIAFAGIFAVSSKKFLA